MVHRSAVSVPVSPASEGEHAASVESCSGETLRSNVTVCSLFLTGVHITREVVSQTSKISVLFKLIYSLWRIKSGLIFSLMEDAEQKDRLEHEFSIFPVKLLRHTSDLSPSL